ncbi:MAG: beta-N-acetylhexosaminidase [Tissierellales bacterium]|nr:beta-N-acetylhexosaminidase [Tissierellales bacterium]
MEKTIKFIAINFIILLLTSCTISIDKPMEKEDIFSENENQDDEIVDVNDKIDSQISKMTIDEKISQLLIIGLDGLELNQNERDLLKEYSFSGIIFFNRNIESKEQFINLINDLKSINADKIPFFLSIDEEGGRVERLNLFYESIPSMGVIGEYNDIKLSYEVGRVLGDKLKTFGLNMNFAPVLDINSNPKNPVIGDRSFGNNPEVVSILGQEIYKGITKQGVISVGKHFPGHGDTIKDSHYELPVINKSLSELEEMELKPFIYNINSGLDAIMVGHLLLPELSDKPSSLSREIINDLLRVKLNFEGIILSDDMTMGAITEEYNLEDAILQFFIAGGDIALVCHDNSEIKDIIEYIKLAIDQEKITEKEIDIKLHRIIYIKEKYNLNNHEISRYLIDERINEINEKIEEIIQEVK